MLMTSLTALAWGLSPVPSAMAPQPVVTVEALGSAAAYIEPQPVEQAPAAPASPAADAPTSPTAAPTAAPTAPAADASAMQSVPNETQAVDTAPASEVLLLRDPWEKPNRDIFALDVAFERHLLAPAAHAYSAVAPQVVRVHISNLIYNLDEPTTTVNALLQLHIGRAIKSGLRFVINSTLGIGGLFDIAATGGLPRRTADFGQTLARYGAKPGPYVMLPLLGPSNLRDGLGRFVDNMTDPMGFLLGSILTPVGAGRFAAEGVNWRQQSDGTMKAVYGATDPYAFARAAYGEQRAAIVQDSTGKATALPDF
jgi:phospholipid-binding lipoprotein MlaA